MASITLTRGKTLANTSYKSDFHDLIDLTTATITNIVNADVAASANIAGTKINPVFGAQDIETTGNCDFGGNVAVSGTANFGGNLTLTGALGVTGDVTIDGDLYTTNDGE